MGLSFLEAPSTDMESLGDEGWPLIHYMLQQTEALGEPLWQAQRNAPDLANTHHDRRTALEALIEVAFGS